MTMSRLWFHDRDTTYVDGEVAKFKDTFQEYGLS